MQGKPKLGDFTPIAEKTQVSEHPTVSGEQQLQNTKPIISSCIFSAWEDRMMNDSAARLITRHNLHRPKPHLVCSMRGLIMELAFRLHWSLCHKEGLSLWFCLGYGKIASAVFRISLQLSCSTNLHMQPTYLWLHCAGDRQRSWDLTFRISQLLSKLSKPGSFLAQLNLPFSAWGITATQQAPVVLSRTTHCAASAGAAGPAMATESQNHRITCVGRDPRRCLVPASAQISLLRHPIGGGLKALCSHYLENLKE